MSIWCVYREILPQWCVCGRFCHQEIYSFILVSKSVHIYRSIDLNRFISIYLSIDLSICLFISIYLSTYLSIWACSYLSIYLSIYLILSIKQLAVASICLTLKHRLKSIVPTLPSLATKLCSQYNPPSSITDPRHWNKRDETER